MSKKASPLMMKTFAVAIASACMLGVSSCSIYLNVPDISLTVYESGTETKTETVTSEGRGKESEENSTAASSSSKASSASGEGYYKATSINDDIDFNRMDGAVPTIGIEDMLVVPVDFTDYKFSNSEIEDIKTLTGGSSAETKYWESLGSFYSKSSFGKLNMNFEYADTYHVGRTAKAFATDSKYTADGYGWTGCLEVLEGAVSAYKKKNGADSTKKFDKDGDGFIDAVIMIYACPNDYDDTIAAFDDEQAYWAYRWCDYNMYESADVNSPVGFNFFWASLDFFYEDTGSRQNHTGIDAHTLIHETGHLLGADDYYNTCTDRQSGGEYHETKSPAGGVMMMDMNRTDHDAFTKMSYGWVEPYVVTGSTEITIKASQVNGDTIILADNWNGTAFDEYIALELYTPAGLNGVDAASVDYNKAGVRMLHVDARLAKATDYNESTDAYVNPAYVKDDEKIDQESYYYFVPARNSAAEDMAPAKGKGYDLISLISAKGNTFTEDSPSTSADLFQTGDSFSISDASASKYFATKGRLNNGAKLPYKIEMVKVTATEATVRFTKFA